MKEIISGVYALSSKSVKVFPCAYRQGVNIEAGITSEFNMTHSSALGLKDAYVISNAGDYIEFVLAGYYFKIKKETITGFSWDANNVYVGIKLNKNELYNSGDDDIYKTTRLDTFKTGSTDSNKVLDSDDTFYGLVVSNSETDIGEGTGKAGATNVLNIKVANNAYAVGTNQIERKAITKDLLGELVPNGHSQVLEGMNGIQFGLVQSAGEQFSVWGWCDAVYNAMYMVYANPNPEPGASTYLKYNIGGPCPDESSTTKYHLIHFKDGVPTASTSTIGSGIKPVYLSNGYIIASTATIGQNTKDEIQPIFMSKGEFTQLTRSSGASDRPVYVDAGKIVPCTFGTDNDKDKLIYFNNGTYTISDSDIGSDTKPVYVKAGKVAECGGTVGSNTMFIYMNNGTLTAHTGAIGGDANPIYINSAGNIVASTQSFVDKDNTPRLLKLVDGSFGQYPAVGDTNKPVYINTDGVVKVCDTINNGTLKIGNVEVFSANADSNIIIGLNGLSINNNKELSINAATESVIGGIKSQTTGLQTGRDYNIQVTTTGEAIVNVPWTDTTYTISNKVVGTTIYQGSIVLKGTTNTGGTIGTSTETLDLYQLRATDTPTFAGLNLNGALNMNGNNINNVGTINATTVNTASDARLKKNIIPYECEKSILDLPIYSYDYKGSDIHTIGCLAQDLKEICPEIVNESASGYLSIEESKLVYLLLQEVKKLRDEIRK